MCGGIGTAEGPQRPPKRTAKRTADIDGQSAECGSTLTVMVSVKPIDAPTIVTLPKELPAVDLLILPRKVSDGHPLYDDSVVTLAKEIRAAGATADYQHDAGSRRWIGEKHVDPLVLDIIAGFITNAGWAGAAAVISKRKSERVRVRFGRRKDSSGDLEEWFEVEGPGAEVAEALRELQQDGPAGKENG